MGILDGPPGNAAEIDPAQIQAEFSKVLTFGERIEKLYQLIRDLRYQVAVDARTSSRRIGLMRFLA